MKEEEVVAAAVVVVVIAYKKENSNAATCVMQFSVHVMKLPTSIYFDVWSIEFPVFYYGYGIDAPPTMLMFMNISIGYFCLNTFEGVCIYCSETVDVCDASH